MKHRFSFVVAGISGVTGVALGAFGAHALAASLNERGMMRAWETATRYHLIHALALFAAAVWLQHATGRAARCATWATYCWTAGIVVFSGSLYGLALEGPRWLGPVTPFGGLALIAGWVCLIAAAFAKDE
jgi:uncharacterized membrane protein YgdD (TMEM256/DUF423 family)